MTHPANRRLFFGLAISILTLSFSSCFGGGPKINSIDPRIGNMGEVLTIQGSGFGDARKEGYVSIAGISPTASSYIEWKDNEIAVRIPDFGDSGLVYVHTHGKKSNPALFTNRASMPQPISGSATGDGPRIDSIDPSSGRIGSLVTITGRNFGASRENSTVQFAWNVEPGPAVTTSPTSVEVFETDFGYEQWSDRELKVRVPDGAISGNLEVQTARGTSIPVFFDVTDRPGTKIYKDKKSYSISYSVDIQIQKASGSNTLYLWLPLPVTSATQRKAQLLSRSMTPFVEDHRGVSLFQLKDLTEGLKTGVSLSYLVDVYAVETNVKSQLIKPDPSSAVQAAYTVPTALIPSDNDEIAALASRIGGKEKNPYIKARMIYDWLVSQGGIQASPTRLSLLDAIHEKKADPYQGALLFCALARALNIPAIPVSGFLIDKNRTAYKHFWAEFWIDGFGWIPVDPSLGSGKAPGAFVLRDDPYNYYFGNLDNQRVTFSRGQAILSQMNPKGRVAIRDQEYSLQTIWEEAVGGLEAYSSLWSDVQVTGIY